MKNIKAPVYREHRYVIAYRNCNTRGEWSVAHKFTGMYARDHARAVFSKIKDDFPNSDLAIFFYREGGDWRDGAIRYAVYGWQGKQIPTGIFSFVNELDTEFF